MKKNLTLFLACFISCHLFSQTLPGQWAWVAGDSAAQQPAVYGTRGVADPANKPFARFGGCSWRDAAGDSWIFGGAYSASGTYFLNDVWKYSSATNLWTWMGGDQTPGQAGVYGTKGQPDPANRPGGRIEFNHWVDAAGNLWIFGGIGIGNATNNTGNLNDLWMYATATNTWTWVSGGNRVSLGATYGTEGVPDPLSAPGCRYGAASFIAKNGDLYIFGGQGESGPDGTFVNNTWIYTPATNLWTWIGGRGIYDYKPVYGAKGVAAQGNVPGGRYRASSWTDPAGNFWLFGGEGSGGGNSGGLLNDMWKYTPATHQWAWIGGDSVANQPGNRGVKGVPSPTNLPGSRTQLTSMSDNAGNFWMYGGVGYSGQASGTVDELFRYNPGTQQWTWVAGGNNFSQPSVYGTKGVSAPENTPGALTIAIGLIDATGNPMIMGGTNNRGFASALWKYTLTTGTLPVKLNGFSAQKDQGSVILRWKTEQEQNSQQFIIERSGNGVEYTKIGAVRAAGNSTASLQYSFTDRNPLAGRNLYRIQQQDQDGKMTVSPTAQVDFVRTAEALELLGNPVRSMLQLRVQLATPQSVQLEVLDLHGHLLQKVDRSGLAGSNDLSLPVDHLARGTYVVRVNMNGERVTRQFVKL